MCVQLYYLVVPYISQIYSIQTDEKINEQDQPHFYSILILTVEKRTVIGTIQVGSMFNEQL